MKTQIKLEEMELLRCPLCGNQLSSQKYTQAMFELRNKVEKTYSIELQKQNVQHESTIKQITDSNDLQLRKLREFYAGQTDTIKKELTNANNKQLSELKRSYEEYIKNQKLQFELSNKEIQKRLGDELERQRNELTQAKELQQKMKEMGIQEGRMAANQNMDKLRNEILQKDIQLQRLNTDLEKLRNETDRTQPELKGEAGEVNLCSLLKNEFKDDIFERTKRGSSSADIVQRIKTSSGLLDVPIVFDNKESQSITKSDIQKAKRYKSIHKTNYVIIVSKNLPKNECGDGFIGEKDGILLLHPSIVLELTRQIRKFLVALSREKISQLDRQNKEERMFSFITSQDVARKLNTLHEVYNKMNDLQVKEQRDHQNLWKTKSVLIAHLLDIYTEITGGIDSIVEGETNS